MKVKLKFVNLRPSINDRYYDLNQLMQKCNEKDDLYVYMNSEKDRYNDPEKMAGKCNKVEKQNDDLFCEVEFYDTKWGQFIKAFLEDVKDHELHLIPVCYGVVENNNVNIDTIVRIGVVHGYELDYPIH